jgi:hypothetical protein
MAMSLLIGLFFGGMIVLGISKLFKNFEKEMDEWDKHHDYFS